MTGRLIAEFRYGHTAHVRATKINNVWWFRIWLGKKRMLVCDCGGFTKYMPNEIVFDNVALSGCSHIVALHSGNVTDDKRIETNDYTISSDFWENQLRRPFFARLTLLGQKMFYPRWVAKAL